MVFKEAMGYKRTQQIRLFDPANVAAGFGAIYQYKTTPFGQKINTSKVQVPSLDGVRKMIGGHFTNPQGKGFVLTDPTVVQPRFQKEELLWFYKAQLYQVLFKENRTNAGLLWAFDNIFTELMNEMVPAHNYVTAIELGHKEAQKRYNFICLIEEANGDYFNEDIVLNI